MARLVALSPIAYGQPDGSIKRIETGERCDLPDAIAASVIAVGSAVLDTDPPPAPEKPGKGKPATP